MAEYPTSDRETGFADDLKALTTHGAGVSFDKFSIFLKVNLVNDVSFMQMDQIVNFASEQHGIWQTAYAFSPAHSPDVSAKNESKYWEELQKIWSALLVEQAPDIADLLKERHDMILTKRFIGAKLQHTSGKPLQRITATASSWLARQLARLGIKGISNRLFAIALFPKGSVGREKSYQA